MVKILIATSTFPVSAQDQVPGFVLDQANALKHVEPSLELLVHAPHNAYSNSAAEDENHSACRVQRYHYFWPYSWERLAGRGILPALKQNRLLYLQIPFFVFFQFLSLLAMTRRQRPDLLYAHWFTPQAITTALVAKITGIPFVFTTHASDVAVLNNVPFSSRLVRQVCRKASAYIAVSDRTAEKLTRFFNGARDQQALLSKLSLIPMGVTTEPPAVAADTRNAVMARYGILADRPSLLFIGRLAEKKGVKYLIQAVASLPTDLRNSFQLIIAGDGQLKSQLQKLTANLTNVTYTGYVTGEDKWTLIDIASFTCFPSIIDDAGDSEGFPVAIMECLAAGKIVLASDVTGAEAVLAENTAGIVFPQKDANALAAAIQSTLEMGNSERQQLESNARRLAQEFDWETIARRHLNLFSRYLPDEL